MDASIICSSSVDTTVYRISFVEIRLCIDDRLAIPSVEIERPK